MIGIIFLLIACNPTKTLQPNQQFLKKVDVKIDSKSIDEDEIYSVIKQKPNKKILGLFRFHLGVYNTFYKRSSKIRDNVGEPPVVYDKLLAEKSVTQLSLLLKNKGYFNNKVSYTTEEKNQKLNIRYHIESNSPYTIKNVNYKFHDPNLGGYILYDKKNSLIKPGQNFDVATFDDERSRIKANLKNHGYYFFSNNFIKYKADTTIGNNEVDITLEVLKNKKQTQSSTDSIEEYNHTKYNLSDINIYLGKNLKTENSLEIDTTRYEDITIFHKGELRYKPKMLRHAIFYNSDETYSLKYQNITYQHLNNLRLFRNINLEFEDNGNNNLTNNIQLTPLPIHAFSIEGIGTNTGGDLGIEGNLIYQNKNLFKGGELLTAKIKGGLEIQRVVGVSSNENEIFGSPFNTLEFGPEVSLSIPRFLLPINMERFSKRANPKTQINSTFNFQKRPEYTRTLAQISFGYFWNETRFKKHFVTPFNTNYVKLFLTDDFRDKVIAENNPFLLNTYTDHYISSVEYSYIFNNQELNKVKNFIYFRFNFETAGNIITAYKELSNAPKNEITNAHEVFGIRYAEYVRSEIDYRYYIKKSTSSFVNRFFVGIGKPYGNLNVLPFEKSFFGGGSNGIRAWQARRLGPGSLSDSLINAINQIGDLKIETNFEYRFDITKLFEGAFFVDAGNIWILTPDEQRPNAEINLNRFYKDLAIGTGFGLRLDFSFFIFRFDLGVPIKNPALESQYKFDLKNANLNLGIGYPF